MSGKLGRLVRSVFCVTFLVCFGVLSTVFDPKMSATATCEGYIYFDLRAGNVSISSSGYSGAAYGLDGTSVTVSGSHTTTNCYFVYQTTDAFVTAQATLYANDPNSITATTVTTGGTEVYYQSYTSLSDTTDGFVDKADMATVISDWATAASNGGRVATGNRIIVTNNSTIDLTIEDLYSSYSTKSQSRTTGGIGVSMPASGGATTIKLRGESRFENIFYGGSSRTSTSTLKITSDDGDGATTGALVVGNLSASGAQNWYDSVIGGSDSTYENTTGLEFAGGTIWAGSNTGDDCTTIGAGGNGYGSITISGGIITAVSSSTGAAIGGGIGYGSAGGIGLVNITGGTIYAYNFGYKKTNQNFVPAAAIGGGSSYQAAGSRGTVNISGGEVYAWALGGAALGGGGSNAKDGGSANVSITGGTVTAISATGLDNTGATVVAGNGIGGGTSNTALGGSASLTISGNNTVVKTGSVGGGKGNGNVGDATVTISGGTIQGQFLMEGSGSSFTMNGGTVDNGNATDEYVFNQTNGGAVYIEGGPATITGGTIQNTSAVNGGAVYVNGGDFTMTGGAIQGTSATNGGAVYVDDGDFTMESGTIQSATASNIGGAIYVNDGDVIIGIEEDYSAHAHPTIQSNTATVNGGGIAVYGGSVTIYCGSISLNTSTQNQASNNLIQEGGSLTVEGENTTIGAGILIGEGATFEDNRTGMFVLTYHAIYTDSVSGEAVSTTTTQEVAANTSGFRLMKEAAVVALNQLFDRSDEDLNLVGWSLSSETEEGYLVAGTKFNVTASIDLYAVYDEDELNEYTITIPETVTGTTTAFRSGSGSFEVACTLNNFDPTIHLNVTMTSTNGFVLESGEDTIEYTAEVDGEEFLNGGTVANFTTTDAVTRTVDLILENKFYAPGDYVDTFTFTFTLVED